MTLAVCMFVAMLPVLIWIATDGRKGDDE